MMKNACLPKISIFFVSLVAKNITNVCLIVIFSLLVGLDAVIYCIFP